MSAICHYENPKERSEIIISQAGGSQVKPTSVRIWGAVYNTNLDDADDAGQAPYGKYEGELSLDVLPRLQLQDHGDGKPDHEQVDGGVNTFLGDEESIAVDTSSRLRPCHVPPLGDGIAQK